MKSIHIKKKSKGFSLVETLVAISILLVTIVGPMTIAADGLQSTFFAREQVVAFMLAQEGMELVRIARDENALADNSWLANIDASCDLSNTNGCGIDIRDIDDVSGSFFDCGGGSACQLRYDSGSLSSNRGFYNYETGDSTPFTRRIWIEEVVGDREAEVSVEVSWTSGVFETERKVLIQSRVFNHYDSI